jgi:hypothetical protein
MSATARCKKSLSSKGAGMYSGHKNFYFGVWYTPAADSIGQRGKPGCRRQISASHEEIFCLADQQRIVPIACLPVNCKMVKRVKPFCMNLQRWKIYPLFNISVLIMFLYVFRREKCKLSFFVLFYFF